MNQGNGNWKKETFTSGGTAPPTQNKPTFGQERVPVHLWSPDAIELTQELVMDSSANLEAALAELIAETKSLDEDIAFLRADGFDKPEGILASGASEVVVGDASTYAAPVAGDNGLSYGRIVDIYIDLAAQYRASAVWLFNSDTFGRILKVEDANSRPLFPLNELPGMLMTRPFFVTEFLDDLSATANKPVIFGAMRHYLIAERVELRVQRLTERFAPNVAFLPWARVGGQVVRPSAFRIGSVQG